ncbi:unspecified product [Leishmania tarentolae]|uniref:Unspecified product n=1 Tax=Leishmania tarentolae TaxID=5689 RepID=A0A640KVQ2_LEITA|nr:unspecified product [Leishmania tarentolae]
MSAKLAEETENGDAQLPLKRVRHATNPDGGNTNGTLQTARVQSTREPRRRDPRSITATASGRLSRSTEGDGRVTLPTLSSSTTALISFDSPSTMASTQSTPAAENPGASAAQDARAALSNEPHQQHELTKECVLSLIIKPVSCLGMVRVTMPLHQEASSLPPQCELKSSADNELCSVAYNERAAAKRDVGDTSRGQKRLRGPEYSKEDIYRLRMKPVRNLSICLVLNTGGGVPGEAPHHSQLSPSSPAVPFLTEVTQCSSATTTNGDDARKADRCRAHHYTKADMMSLRLKPLKGYAVYPIS